MTELIVPSVVDSVGVIELARPEKFNCLSSATMKEIDKARQAFESNSEIGALLIQAQGDNFSTGADLEEVTEILGSAEQLDTFIEGGQNTLMRLEASPLPVVVAVQGLCLAGGIELMLTGDICIAAETAQFGDQHAQFGLIPGWGGSQRLSRILGLRRALDLLYTAQWISAQDAAAFGLVNSVVPDDTLAEAAMDYCRALATRSRAGIAEMKRLARDGLELPIAAAMRLERDAVVRHLQSDDAKEGLAAFQARRTPSFRR